MKHFVRDIIIFLISILGISYLYRKHLSKKGPLVRVIAFHNISDKDWFERTIKFLVEKYHVITPEQFHKKEFHSKKINILITFDDGYASWVSKALPVLETYGAKAIFFVTSGLLETAEDKEARETFFKERLLLTPKSALTWNGVEQLLAAGHTIGGHTVTHPILSRLEQNEVEKEIVENKAVLESRLSIRLADFAYPFGRKEDYSKDVQEKVVGTGYTYVYTAETGFLKHQDAAFIEIPRTLAEENQSLSSINRWVLGSYDLFSSLNKL